MDLHTRESRSPLTATPLAVVAASVVSNRDDLHLVVGSYDGEYLLRPRKPSPEPDLVRSWLQSLVEDDVRSGAV